MAGQTHNGIPGLRFAVSHKCRFHLSFSLDNSPVVTSPRQTYSPRPMALPRSTTHRGMGPAHAPACFHWDG